MELTDLFHKWVPNWVRIPVLFILFFIILTANGIFLGNSNDIASNLGVYTEPYTESFNAIYIGMGLGLLFELRLKMRFTSKTLLLNGLCFIFLMNVICATTNNPRLFVVACLIIGFTKMTALVEVYIVWLAIWSKKMDTSRLYPFVYFTALAGLHLMTWLTSRLAYIYNWRYAYIWVLILVAICIILTLIFVDFHPLKKRIPFYQVDFIGLITLGASMMLLNYAVVNGRVEDWFNSQFISNAFFGGIILFILFTLWEINKKRPLFDFKLFKGKNFRFGLLLLTLLGFISVSTFQSAFSAGTLHYEAARNMELNLYLVPGILAGCIVSYLWYYFALDADIIIIIGFTGFVVYHVLMYQSFSNEFAMGDFWIPSIVKGFATALIYIAVGLYTSKGLPLMTVMTSTGAMIMVRSFIGGGIGAALYSYWFYEQRIRSFEKLAGMTDSSDFQFGRSQALSNYATLQQQASLTASKEISGYIIIGGLVLIVLLIMRYGYQKIYRSLAV